MSRIKLHRSRELIESRRRIRQEEEAQTLESLRLCNRKQVLSHTHWVCIKCVGGVGASEPFDNMLYCLSASRFSSYLDDMNVRIWRELLLLGEVEQSQRSSMHHRL